MSSFVRTGPHPLPTHIALASAAVQCSMPQEEAHKKIKLMLAGIKKYQSYNVLPMMKDLECVEQIGQGRLLYVAPEAVVYKHPVLLVPSLINRYNIFDLYKKRSFARWLAEQGHPVYILDWGCLTAEEGDITMDVIVQDRLNYCAAVVARRHQAAVHAVGYCMGGTLLLGGAALDSALYNTLVFLSAPWDFSAVGNILLAGVRSWAPSAFSYMAVQGALPSSYLQNLFAALYPEQTAEKFSRFSAMEEGSEDAHIFVAVEDWLNDGADLPSHVARVCIQDWFLNNDPVRGGWSVCNESVQPELVDRPAFVVASTRDKLVEYGASAALYKALPDAEIYDPQCGHIGMMAGRHAVEKVWKPISAWIASKDGV